MLRGAALSTVALVGETCPGWAAQPDVDAPRPDERAAMRRAVEGYLHRHRAPGLACAIARHGQLVYADAFGVADIDSGERLTSGHRFRIASVSKPITSVAVFTLIERGALRLSDRVFGANGVLGRRFSIPAESPGLSAITVEHLLTHSAGGWANDGSDPMFDQPHLDHAALIGWTIRNRPLIGRPGTTYAYSNFGYCLLGRVIEQVSGKPYAEYVQEAVLRPAGVRTMTIAANSLARRAPGEVRYHAPAGIDPYALNVQRMDAHGGWVANVLDLVRFATRVDGFPPGELLKPETIRTMTIPSSMNAGYAKGWAVNRAGNWWHVGSLAGSTSLLVRTSTRLCWAALVNAGYARSSMGDALDQLMWTLVRAVPRWGA